MDIEADQARRREIFRNDQLERIANALWTIAANGQQRVGVTVDAVELEAAYEQDRGAEVGFAADYYD